MEDIDVYYIDIDLNDIIYIFYSHKVTFCFDPKVPIKNQPFIGMKLFGFYVASENLHEIILKIMPRPYKCLVSKEIHPIFRTLRKIFNSKSKKRKLSLVRKDIGMYKL